ncbi:MAG TPA: TQO small subunit DoxD [Longimicrobiales bacterium]
MSTHAIEAAPPRTTGDASSRHAPRFPGRWLAFLRITVGLWFLKGIVTKMSWFAFAGFIPLPRASDRWVNFLPRRLLEYASQNPIEPYRQFLLDVAVPNAGVFAYLTAFGETAVGIGLAFGLLTGYASIIGFFLMANYFMASYWTGMCQQGFHALLMACMLAFLGARAGRVWGVDGWLVRRYPRIPLI